ncbi:MAG: type II toxin-antitoxin system HicB family antitoxin [Deltaproteobacteria bacterium]|nr:type II toxin-antitoxin system HicB family antitoxin [Deltaproteobacteria bacterium]
MKRKKYQFEVVFEKEEKGGYHAYCPDLPGCHTCGSTLKKAKKYIGEAIEAYCEALRKSGDPIPQSRSQKVITSQINISLKAA